MIRESVAQVSPVDHESNREASRSAPRSWTPEDAPTDSSLIDSRGSQSQRPFLVPRVIATTQSGTSPSAPGPLAASELEQLRETEIWRSRIRVASVLCLVMFWIGVIYSTAFAFTAIFLLSEARRGQDRAAAVTVLFTALVTGGTAALSFVAGRANRRCARWASLTMCVVELLGSASLVVLGLTAAIAGGGLMLIAMWIVAIVPAVFALFFLRSWDAIPRYLDRPDWCRQTLEHCGL